MRVFVCVCVCVCACLRATWRVVVGSAVGALSADYTVLSEPLFGELEVTN